MIYLTSNASHHVEERYSSLEEGPYEYDVVERRYNVHMVEQHVFSNSEDDYVEPQSVEVHSHNNVRILTEEEIERLIVAAVEEAKNKYWLRNRMVNEKEGIPRGIFMKD